MTSPSPISSTGSASPDDQPPPTDPVEPELAESAQDPSAHEAASAQLAEFEQGAELAGDVDAADPDLVEVETDEVFDGAPARLAGSAVRNSDHAISARSTVALILSGLLVALLCVGGAAIGGFFSDVANQDGQDGEPSATATAAVDGVTSFADGEFAVGSDIKSGTYTTKVPADSTCSWERASSSDGSADSVVDSGMETSGKEVVVTIKPTDEVFRSQGCGTWHPVKT